MSGLASCSTILLIPVDPVSASDAKFVINRVQGGSVVSGSSQDASTEEDNADSHSNVIPWTISNRYYTADVQFRILDPTSASAIEEALKNGEEPAVVVLTRSQESPPPALKTLLEKVAARTPEFDVALLITLPTSAPSSTSSPSSPLSSDKPNEDKWDDLALDHGFEWIELGNLSSIAFDAKARESDEHGEGFGRIRDALESHMWEGMKRISKSSGAVKGQGGRGPEHSDDDLEEDAVEGEEEDLHDDKTFGVPPLPEPRPFIPMKLEFPSTFLPSIPRKSAQPHAASTASSSATLNSSSLTNDPPSASSPHDTTFDDDFSPFVEASSDTTSYSSFPSSSSTLSSSTTSVERDQENETRSAAEHEDDLDELDSLFDRIRLAREEVLVGGEGIDEEEMLRRRREKAEQLLAEVMGGL